MFKMHGFADDETEKEHVVLTMGDISGDEPLLARVHSECLTGDALFSLRCDCGPQLHAAMHKIALEGRGVLFYLRQDRKSTRLNSSHVAISYAVFCLIKKIANCPKGGDFLC